MIIHCTHINVIVRTSCLCEGLHVKGSDLSVHFTGLNLSQHSQSTSGSLTCGLCSTYQLWFK